MLNTFEQQLQQEIARKTNSSSTNSSSTNSSSTNSSSANSSSTDANPMRGRPIGVSEGLLYEELSRAIVGAAIEVHRHIGPGQLESVYQRALGQELALREIPHRAQVPVTMLYKGCSVGDFYVDLIVDDKIIVELKAVSGFEAVHAAQVLSYLRSTNLRLGLLINFNVPVLWRGVRRLIR
jgi:GxxExxY protein